MNEKIKTFFAYIGGIFVAIAVFLFGLFGKRNNNSDSKGMGDVDSELKQARDELAEAGRTQSEAERLAAENRAIIDECKSIIESVKKRNDAKTN